MSVKAWTKITIMRFSNGPLGARPGVRLSVLLFLTWLLGHAQFLTGHGAVSTNPCRGVGEMPVRRSLSVPGESPADCFKTKVMKNRVNVSLCWRQDGQVENKEETLNGAITCRNNFEDPMASITALNYTRSERRSFPFDEKNHGDKDLFQRLPSSHHDTSTNSKGTVRILEDPMVSITALNYTNCFQKRLR